MKKILFIILGSILVLYLLYIAFVYYVTYSEGTRAGELIKFSHRGVVIKTWEGEISQGISGAQIFSFSVLDQDEEVIEKPITRLMDSAQGFGRIKVPRSLTLPPR